MTLGDRIKQAREARGMTMLQLAEKIGVREATVSRYESGTIKNLPQSRLVAIAKALGVDSNYLMDWDGPEPELQNNGDLMDLREQLRRQPGMRILFDASKNATEQDLLDAAALIEGFKRRRDGEE